MWTNWLRSTRRGSRSKAGVHLTYARSQMGRSLSSAGLFLKRQLWIWPIIAVLTLSIVGYFVLKAIGGTIEASVGRAASRGRWRCRWPCWTRYVQQKTNAEALANSSSVREAMKGLSQEEGAAAEGDAPQPRPEPGTIRSRLQRELAPWLTSYEFVNFFVCDKDEKVLAASQSELVGQSQLEAYRDFVRGALKGKTTVSAPFKSVSAIKNADGVLQYNVPTMFVAAPIRDAAFQVIGAIALRIRPEARFTAILQTGRIGESGETYAINRDGVMASNSRFDNDLILSGILPETDGAASILNVRLVDPGGDVTSDIVPECGAPTCRSTRWRSPSWPATRAWTRSATATIAESRSLVRGGG